MTAKVRSVFGRSNEYLPWRSTWCTELRDQVVQALSISTILWVNFLKRSLKPQGCQDCRRAMTRTDDVEYIQVVLRDQ